MRYLVFAIFVLVGSCLLYFAHRYLWVRLVRDTELRSAWRKMATLVIVVGGLTVPVTMSLAKIVPREYVELLALGAFAWLGGLLYLLIILAPFEVARRKVERPDRRRFLARAAAGTALAGSAGLITIGTTNALGELETPEIEVPLKRLPKALDGFKIVQLTDVHIGPILDRRFLKSVVEKANEAKPDLIVITGDLVDGRPSLIGRDVAELSRLQSRYGTFFVTGNHEYYSGVTDWVDFLAQHDIKTLLNERVTIGNGAASFDLAGITDRQGGLFHSSHAPDMARALAGRDPERELVLLAHRPNPIDEAAELGVGLQLSGHTHGGQLWPITHATRLIHPYSDGLNLHDEKTWIYVSRGTGFWGPPMRIAAPAEITSLILSAA